MAVDVRSYSRITGQTSAEVKAKRSGAISSTTALTAASCAPSRQLWRRATMIPSAPRARAPATAAAMSARVGTCVWRPSARIRAGRPKMRSRGISGSARWQKSEYISGIRSRASSITSSNPALVRSASRAPFRWMIVLMPTVVPWTNRLTCAGSSPSRSARSARPVSSSAPGSSGVVSTLSEATRPERVSSAQKSMKVPPMSTPIFQSAAVGSAAVGSSAGGRACPSIAVPFRHA